MITIFTPTYNRAKLLGRVYDSLKSQTVSDFEWLIVDDGSVDDTASVVETWINERLVRIRYICQENRGKHTAFNNGVRNALGELFFCVDSDDYIPPHCIEDIIDAWSGIESDNVAGIIGLKSDAEGALLSGQFPKGIAETTTYDLAGKHKCYGEKSMIYKTSILKEYPYPEFHGEKFIGECVVYDKIDQSYVMLLLPKVLTVCEYLPDGYSASADRLMQQNPCGFCLYFMQRIDMCHKFFERIFTAGKYHAFRIFSGKALTYRGKHPVAALLSAPLGRAFWLYYKIFRNF